MAKIYSEKSLSADKMKPRKEIITFLLNYSKSLSYLKVKGLKIEIISN